METWASLVRETLLRRALLAGFRGPGLAGVEERVEAALVLRSSLARALMRRDLKSPMPLSSRRPPDCSDCSDCSTESIVRAARWALGLRPSVARQQHGS